MNKNKTKTKLQMQRPNGAVGLNCWLFGKLNTPTITTYFCIDYIFNSIINTHKVIVSEIFRQNFFTRGAIKIVRSVLVIRCESIIMFLATQLEPMFWAKRKVCDFARLFNITPRKSTIIFKGVW